MREIMDIMRAECTSKNVREQLSIHYFSSIV